MNDESGMKLLRLNLANTQILLYQLAAGTADALHDHGDWYQISIPVLGQPTMQFNQQTWRLNEEQLVVTAPGDRHRNLAIDDAARLLVISVHGDFLREVFQEQTGQESETIDFTPLAEGSALAVRRVAERAFRDALDIGAPVTQTSELEWEIAERLLSLHPGSHSRRWRERIPASSHPALQRVLTWIAEAYADEITLADLTRISGLRKSQLIRLFREHTGQTPGRYVTQVRLQRARDLLASSALDVTGVAFEVGFGSLSAFERAFRQEFGMQPAAYRRTLPRAFGLSGGGAL